MKARLFFLVSVFMIFIIAILFYSCENSTSTDPVYPGNILGWVYEDSTKLPLSGVKVWADGIPDTLYTNDSGKFHYEKISMPRGEWTYYLIFQKAGYADKSYSVFCKSDTETKIDSMFMKRIF